jgi:O-antigen ligase
MGFSLLKILSFANLAGFLFCILFLKGDKNRRYIQYILLAYPLMALFVIPMADGFDLITILFVLFFYRKRQVNLYNGAVYTILFAVLMISIGIGLFVSDFKGPELLHELIAIGTIFAFAKILIDECLYDIHFFYDVVKYLKITLITSLLFLCCQFVFGIEFALIKTYNPNIILADAIRYPSFLSDPQTYSQFLAVSSFLFLIRDYRDEKFNKLNYVFVMLSIVAILVAGGRAGLAGWALGMLLVVLFGSSTYRWSIIGAGAGLYVIAMQFQDKFAFFKRGTDVDETYEFRHGIWMDAWNIFLKFPFVGIGLSNYSSYVAVHNPDQVWIIDNEFVYFDHPENGFLKILTELGAIGFICIFGMILISMIRSFVYYLISKDTSLILLIAAVLSWMVGFYTTYSFGDVRIKLLIVNLVCLLITSRQRLEAIYDITNPEEEISPESAATETHVEPA